MAESLIRSLEAEFGVISVATADMAIDTLDVSAVDLILLDVMLGSSNAFTLLHELQSHDDLAHLPVILVTSVADSLDPGVLKEYGVREVIDKANLEPTKLSVSIRKYA